MLITIILKYLQQIEHIRKDKIPNSSLTKNIYCYSCAGTTDKLLSLKYISVNGCLRLQLFLLGNTTHARRHTRKRYGHTRARGFICINAVVFYVALIHVSSYNGNNPGHINFLYFVSKLIRYQCYISNCLRNNMIGLKASGGSDLQ
ncbi:hypothetical protein BCV71DRAFT_283892 [Rhizopus microsporus]|uniref:Uncharacterized protein n=1 Tax=Rhizopus microsporus TaxID=58291 RepID=A0A1X0RJI9_RHIZD|nr:hypothetical protein BCV71DRAFT_283892 [Rhizopus microsporus]